MRVPHGRKRSVYAYLAHFMGFIANTRPLWLPSSMRVVLISRYCSRKIGTINPAR
jgi:hypothetical protein